MNTYRMVTRRLNFFEKLIQANYTSLFLMWIMMNAGFTALYFTLSTLIPAHGLDIPVNVSTGERLFDSLYFSVVTATTVGYGDITALGFAKLLVMIESTVGLLIFTVLVGKLVGQRQDATLHEVHRMTFEGIFYHIRHVLFIVRKDLDEVIRKVESGKDPDEHDWKNLTTAYLQAHSLIDQIPDLYDGHGFDLRNVNINREKLLFESLHRTLERAHSLMKAFDAKDISWRTHATSMQELRRLADVVDSIMPVWRERSPFHEEQEFEEMLTLASTLHKDIRQAVVE